MVKRLLAATIIVPNLSVHDELNTVEVSESVVEDLKTPGVREPKYMFNFFYLAHKEHTCQISTS